MSENLSEQVGRTDEKTELNLDLSQWRWKTNTNLRKIGLFTTYDRLTASICALFVFLSVGATLSQGMTYLGRITIYFLTIGFIFGFDPAGMFALHFATITRFLIMFNDWLVVCSLWVTKLEFRILTAIVFALTVLYVTFMNKTMLRAENFKYSERIQHAKIEDPDNDTGEAWKNWAKRECRTLFGDIGLPTDDEVVDGIGKPVFYMTYFWVKKKFKKDDAQLKKELEELKEQVATYEEAIKAMGQENVELKYQKDRYEDKATQIARSDVEFQKLEEKMQAMEVLIEQLTEANEYLAENPEQLIDAVVERNTDYLLMSEEERIFECFRLGMKNKEIEKAFGKPKSTVSDMKKRYLKTLEEN